MWMEDGLLMQKNKVFAITALDVDQEQRLNSILLIWAVSTSCLCMVFAGCVVWLLVASKEVDIRVLTVEKSSKQLVEVVAHRRHLKLQATHKFGVRLSINCPFGQSKLQVFELRSL